MGNGLNAEAMMEMRWIWAISGVYCVCRGMAVTYKLVKNIWRV